MAVAGIDRPMEVLTLDLQGEIFALDAQQVREILDHVPITEVPGSQPFVNGLINVRGKVVPLADLRIKFGMEQKEATIDTRVVVIEIDLDGQPMIVGIRADKVYEVTELAPAALEETPRLGMRWRPEFIRCIGKRGSDFIVVPDISRIFALESGELAVATEANQERGAASPLRS
jgi:purine-binding chemotaxis protein CheW